MEEGKKRYKLEQLDHFWILTRYENGENGEKWEKWVVEGPLAAERIIERNHRDGQIVEVITLNDKRQKENKHERE